MTFGILTAAFPGRAAIRYAFKPADVIWTARYVAATTASGESDYARRRDLIWRLLERFAVHAYRYRASGGQQSPEGRSFRAFMRQYFPSIPRTPWNALPAYARGFAIAIASGRLVRPASSAVSIDPVADAYGWNRELEGDGGDAAVQPPPPQAGNAPNAPPPSMSPPVDVGAPAPPAQATPDMSGMDGSAMSSPPPMPDADPVAEPPEQPGTFPALDGNQLVLSPWLLNGLVGQRRRRHYYGWPYSRYPGYSNYWNYSSYPNYSTYRPYTGYQTYRPYGGYYNTYRPYGYSNYRPYNTSNTYNTYSGYRPYGVSSTYRPYATSFRSTTSPYRPHSISSQIARLAQNARHIGTLRQRQTGRTYPVFGGSAGARNFRMITRPVGGRHFEIMSVQGHELESELATAP